MKFNTKRWEKISPTEQKVHVTGPGHFVNPQVLRDISGNTIIYRWNESVGSTIFLTLFAFFWNAIAYGVVFMTMNGAPIRINRVPYPSLQAAFEANPFILIFLLFHLIGAMALYWCLSLWFNKTTFTFDGLTLKKKVGPFPYPGSSLTLSHSSVSQFYVQKSVSKSSKGATHISYRVIALRTDGPEVEIHNASRSYQSARILEQWLEEKMGIEDRPIPDEVD